jgi:glycosyltransferase involved in cell wall biosynthesis
MRIAFLSPFYPYRGGIAQFSDSLYLELEKSHKIKAFTFKRQYPKMLFPGKSQYVSKEDLNRGIDAERVLDTINPFTYAKTAIMISDYKPEVFLLSYWMPYFAPSLGRTAGSIKKKNPNVKIISILHNVLPHEKRTGDLQLTKYFLNKCDGFVVLNEKSKHDLLKLKPDTKYTVLPHPLYDHYGERIETNDARSKLGIPADKKVLLFFGLIRNYKGLDILLESLALLDESYYLIIAGEVYGSFGKYKSIIDKHSLQNRVLLHTEFIPENEIALYFSASDVCVLPYRSGTQSGIEGIAYHFDLPVIVTDVGGLKETVGKHNTGIVVSKPDSNLLKEAISKYFGSEPGIFKSNINKYKKQYSWGRFAEGLVKFWGQI